MEMVMLPVALVTAGGAALIALWLAIRVGQARTKAKIFIGDGGDQGLICRMRAQANFVEYAPFIIILIALIEFTAGTSTWLWVASALFLLARIVHPLGMDGLKYARSAGTGVTFLLLLGLGGYAIALPLIAMEQAPVNDPVEAVVPSGG
ncbi:MAPEG family protein [Sphingomonas sp.]|uniref:MAPEG family protein n=1 Tax=Sphingomonas sp. TaxID=28214 RepID=UPI003D6D9212